MKSKRFAVIAFLVVLVLSIALTACGAVGNPDPVKTAKENGNEIAKKCNESHFDTNTECTNYWTRQEIANDPSTILWCTFSFPNPSSPLVTVPIVGKLTSGTKRPYSTSWANNSSTADYSPELAGPDGMFGPSSDQYRYGFGPRGASEYYDFDALPTFCTNVPLVWQRESTVIVSDMDAALMEAQNQAQDLIEQGKTDEAADVLNQAIGDSQ